MRSLIAIVTVLTSLLLRGPFVAAQELPTPVPPEECTVEPRSVDEVLALIEKIEPNPTARQMTPSPFVPPEGQSAPGEVVEGVTATMTQYIACGNAGDLLRVASLYSDEYILRTPLSSQEEKDELLQAVKDEKVPMDDNEWASLVVGDVMVLEGDRVGAYVEISEPGLAEPLKTFFYFKQVADGRWLIDQINLVDEPSFIQASPPPQKRIPLLIQGWIVVCFLKGYYCPH